MPEPVHIAAIDAGSNALRLSVARAYSALDIEPLHEERYPLRLGKAFFFGIASAKKFSKKAAKAFRHFREVTDEFGVTRYRAWRRAQPAKRKTARSSFEPSERTRGWCWK